MRFSNAGERAACCETGPTVDVPAGTGRQQLVIRPRPAGGGRRWSDEELEAVCRKALETLQRIAGQPKATFAKFGSSLATPIECWSRTPARASRMPRCGDSAERSVGKPGHPMDALRHRSVPGQPGTSRTPHPRRCGADELALRAGQLFIPHLEPLAVDSPLRPSRLVVGERGSVNGLRFEPLEREPVPANRVEVEVHTSALNFRDVLNVLGPVPGEAGPLGVGRSPSSSVGGKVSGIRPGYGVMGLGWGSLRDVAMANPDLSHTCRTTFRTKTRSRCPMPSPPPTTASWSGRGFAPGSVC